MLAPAPPQAVRDLQNAIRVHGKTCHYYEAGSSTGRAIRARVVYQGAAELANSIEAYPMRVTLDARDFLTRAPLKGDTIVIDGARRGVMQVAETHLGDALVAYRCGVQG